MSRSWLGRSTGKHAAGPRGRNAGPAKAAPAGQAPPPPPVQADRVQADAPWPEEARLFGAPTLADAPAPEAPLASPVTEEARDAAAGIQPSPFMPADAFPLVTIDALGRKCPIPIIMLANQIRDVPVGAVIAVLADDPAAYTDVPAWCALKSHDCVFRTDYAAGWSFGIRRRY
jgi:tRNA 2-thiouridine synthesizing protein A